MNLYQSLEDDAKQALKLKDAVKLSVLRMLLSDIKMLEIQKNVKRLEEPDILQVIQKQVKQHKESITQFEAGKRQDLVEKETGELKILETYMPKQLSEEEILAIIKEAISATGASTKADIGKVMKAVMEKTRLRADGKMVAALVAKSLNASDF